MCDVMFKSKSLIKKNSKILDGSCERYTFILDDEGPPGFFFLFLFLIGGTLYACFNKFQVSPPGPFLHRLSHLSSQQMSVLSCNIQGRWMSLSNSSLLGPLILFHQCVPVSIGKTNNLKPLLECLEKFGAAHPGILKTYFTKYINLNTNSFHANMAAC